MARLPSSALAALAALAAGLTCVASCSLLAPSDEEAMAGLDATAMAPDARPDGGGAALEDAGPSACPGCASCNEGQCASCSPSGAQCCDGVCNAERRCGALTSSCVPTNEA